MNRTTYRKKSLSEPQYIIKYVDANNQQHEFKSTKLMLESHKKLMQNNKYIKSFSVQPITKE